MRLFASWRLFSSAACRSLVGCIARDAIKSIQSACALIVSCATVGVAGVGRESEDVGFRVARDTSLESVGLGVSPLPEKGAGGSSEPLFRPCARDSLGVGPVSKTSGSCTGVSLVWLFF